MSLYDKLAKIGQQVKSQLPQMKNHESATVHVSVLPFIRALGYNTQDLSEVYPEYSILNMDAVDYAVLQDGEPIIFLEAKKAGENLSAKHWKQLFEYFNADKARIGILTNGIKYRFYSDFDQKNLMDKAPFLTLDLLKLDKATVEAVAGFSKANYDPEKSLRKLKIRNLIERELREPSDDFVRVFAKRVHNGSLWKEVIAEYRPIVKQVFDELMSRERPDDPPPPPPPDTDYIPIYGYYEGHRFKAELLRKSINDGLTIGGHQIRFNGEMTWLKNAAVIAIRSVDPSFVPTKTFPNGFTFWFVVDPADGKEHMIRYISGWEQTDDALRQRVLKKS